MRMQQEAGENRRKGRTDSWQMMQGNLVAEPCHERAELSRVHLPCSGLGSSGDNSMSFPFLWVFHFIPTLAGDKAVWGGSQHLSSLQFYWSTVGSKSSFKN